MYDYGEACPMSKATALLCERWTLQIIREMFLGASRFSEFQKYLPKISPTLLNTRLRLLVDNGVAIKKRIPEKRGFEYHLTPAGKDLAPLMSALGAWGARWVYGVLSEAEHDVESTMRAIAETIETSELPGGETVLQFTFTDTEESPRWFITVKNGKCEHCDVNMGYEVDVFLRTSVVTLERIWWGQMSIAAARDNELLKVTGPASYTKSMHRWFPTEAFSACRPESGETA